MFCSKLNLLIKYSDFNVLLAYLLNLYRCFCGNESMGQVLINGTVHMLLEDKNLVFFHVISQNV